MTGDGGGDLARDDRALAWLAALLGPDPYELADGAGPVGPGERWAVLPSAGRPRVLVPLGARRAAAAVLDRDTGFGGRGRRLAAVPFRLGITPPGVGGRMRVPAGCSFARWAAEVLDEPDLRAGVTIGPPRPNRKPVVQLVRPDGTTAAWAKVAWNPLTGSLLANETAWLDRVWARPPPGLEAPTVLARNEWQDHDVLVTAPLPTRRRTAPLRPTRALLEAIAGLDEVGTHPATSSSWWSATRQRAAAVTSPGARARVTGALDGVGGQLGGVVWRFGAWHGDLTAWNATEAGSVTQVWDWERADGDRPIGFDAAHAAFQRAQVGERRTVTAAADAAERELEHLLGALDVDPRSARPMATAYLVERWLRSEEDTRLNSTSASGELHGAILEAIVARTPTPGGGR